MTPREFPRMALSLPKASASAHMGHPDFRIGGRIFATLGYPSRAWGMVKLTPQQQQLFVRAQPGTFVPVKGAWGRAGNTNARLRTVGRRAAREALRIAWRNCASRSLVAKIELP